MTREEAREELKEMIEYEWGTYFTNTAKKHVTALKMAIKALEREPFINKACVSNKVCEHDKKVVLDKIRTEIESIDLLAEYTRGDIKRMALATIDKYKAESEGK